MLLCSIPLEPEDGDTEVGLSQVVHGAEITCASGGRLVSISLGEGRAGGVLEMSFLMEQTVLAAGGVEGRPREGESRNRATGVGSDGLHRPAEGHADELGGRPSRYVDYN